MLSAQLFIFDIIKSVTPIFFGFASIGATLLSGLIEFLVLRDIVGLGTDNFFFPLALVIVFEYTKYYLHYLSARIKLHPVKGLNPDVLTVIKYITVAISILCTVIFMVNALFYDVDKTRGEELKTQTEIINNDYVQAVKQLDQRRANDKKEVTEYYDTQIAQAQVNLAEHRAKPEAFSRRTREAWEAEEATLIQEYENAVSRREDGLEAYQVEADRKYSIDIVALKTERDQKFQQMQDSVLDSRSGDIAIIRTFLLFAADMFRLASYSRRVYGLFSVSIALAFGILLELIISVGQNYMSLDRESIKVLTNETGQEDGHKYRAIVNAIIVVGASLASYIALGLIINNVIVTKSNVIVVALCYLAVNVFTRHLVANHKLPVQREKDSSADGRESKKSGILDLLHRLGFVHDIDGARQELSMSFLKSVLAFCAFAVVGIVGGINSPDAVTSLGVAAGGFIGNMMTTKI